MQEDAKPKHDGGWWGILLIAIGALLLLNNFGLIAWNWYALWQSWPALLVIWGIGTLDIDERAKRVVIAVIVAAALFWVMGGFGSSSFFIMQQDRMMRFPGGHMYWR
jgi:hypothetical protein